MTRAEQAEANFKNGYNCAQAMLLAFADLLPFDSDTALRLSSSFGGGMGRLREVCGAVSAMFMVAGVIYGYNTPETGEIKKEHYARIQDLAKRFEARYGTIICRDLLGLDKNGLENGHDVPTPAARTAEYYGSRPCPCIIRDAAEILEQYINENAGTQNGK